MEVAPPVPRSLAEESKMSTHDERNVEWSEVDSCPPSVETASDSSADSGGESGHFCPDVIPPTSVKCLYDLEISSSSTTAKKRVSFGELEVRKFAIMLGDHPDVNGGPPLTIDWECIDSFKVSIDEFEMKRSGSRRKQTHLRLLAVTRVQILQRSTDTSSEDIEKASVDAYLFNNQRMRTLQSVLFYDMLKQTVKRLFRFGRKPPTISTPSPIVVVKKSV